MTCSIRPVRSNKSIKTLRCIIREENGTADIFQKHKHYLVHTGFLVPGNTTAFDNAALYAKGDNEHLKDSFKSIGIDVFTLPKCSPELNLIELMCNAMVQRFKSEHNSKEIKADKDALNSLTKVVDSIRPDVMFAYYEKCGYNFFY